MQIEAIYEDGRLELPRHVRLKQRRVRLIIDIPDDEILREEMLPQAQPEPAPELSTEGSTHSVIDEINAILHPWRDRLANLEPIEKNARRELFAKEWEERHRASD
jgi:hypothetical protein